jgi:hypothetical protein
MATPINRAMLDAIGASKASNKSDNIRDGQGVLLVEEIVSFDGNDGPTFVARCEVVSSSSKGDVDPVTKQPTVPNAVGSQVGWVQKLQKFKSSMGNVKKFIVELAGETEAALDATPGKFAEVAGGLLSDAQPARGMLINYSTYQQTTRSGPNAGKVNTYVNWSHHADNSDAAIDARRADLDKRRPLGK